MGAIPARPADRLASLVEQADGPAYVSFRYGTDVFVVPADCVVAPTLAATGSWLIGLNLKPGFKNPRSFCRNANTVAAECSQLRAPDSANPGPPFAPRSPNG